MAKYNRISDVTAFDQFRQRSSDKTNPIKQAWSGDHSVAIAFNSPTSSPSFPKSLAEANLNGSTVNRVAEEPQDSQFTTASL